MRPFSYCKLEIFLPASHLSPLETALRQVDAGHIGAYDSCLSYSPVTSCWRPLAGTTPYLGTQGALSREQELKVEVTCQTERVEATVAAIRAVHPYEEHKGGNGEGIDVMRIFRIEDGKYWEA